jgi:hypothetical protein
MSPRKFDWAHARRKIMEALGKWLCARMCILLDFCFLIIFT